MKILHQGLNADIAIRPGDIFCIQRSKEKPRHSHRGYSFLRGLLVPEAISDLVLFRRDHFNEHAFLALQAREHVGQSG